MIALAAMNSNRLTLCMAALLLLLSGCATAFHPPHPRPGEPIITNGVFHLRDGTQLPYRVWRPQGPMNAPMNAPVKALVLALHGFDDSRDGWAIPAAALSKAGIEVIAPDQPGFGATADRGQWAGTAAYLDDARQMIAQLQQRHPGTKLTVMGESMGGAEILLLAGSANPPPGVTFIASAPAVWGGAALNPLFRASLAVGNALAPAYRLTGKQAAVRASDNIAALIAFSRDPLTIRATRIGTIAGLVRMMGDALQACATLRAPTFILYGGKDQLIPKGAMAACWRSIPPDAPVILGYYPPDYHMIPRDLERATPLSDIISYILHPGQGLPSAAPINATIFLATH